MGIVVSMLGMFISNLGDFPTGPSIVAAFAATLVGSGILHYLTAHEHSGVAARRLLAGGAIVALLVWGTTFLRKQEVHVHGPEDPEWPCSFLGRHPDLHVLADRVAASSL